MAVPSPFNVKMFCSNELEFNPAMLAAFLSANNLGVALTVTFCGPTTPPREAVQMKKHNDGLFFVEVNHKNVDFEKSVRYARTLPCDEFSNTNEELVHYAMGYVAGQIEGHITTQIAMNKERDNA